MSAGSDPRRLVDVLRGLRGMGKGDPRAWARALQLRERNGDALSDAQRAMWRQALGAPAFIEGGSDGSDGDWNERKRLAQRRVDDYRGGSDDAR